MVKIGSKIDEVRVDGSLFRLRKDLEQYASLGIEVVELPVHGLDAIRNGKLDGERLQSLQSVLRDFSFEYTVHSPNPLNLMDQEEIQLHMDVFLSTLQFAAEVGATVVVYHAGRFIPEETFPVNGQNKLGGYVEERWLQRERGMLRQLADAFPEVVICVENARPYRHHSPYCYAEKLEDLYRQVATVERSNVRINLDIGHLHMASRFYGFNLVESVRHCKDLIAHTHIHDNFGGAVHHYEKQQTHQIPFGRGDSHMPVGWGAIPLAEVLGAYLSGYSGVLMMELRGRYFHKTEESLTNLRDLIASMEGR